MGVDYFKNLKLPVFGSSGQPLSPDAAADWWGGFDTSNTYVPGSGGGGDPEFVDYGQYFGNKGGLASIKRG
jgi:hypothetical protein